MIQTQFEINGEWSSVDYGDQVVQTISDETDAELMVIGQSVNGRDLLGLKIGQGSRKILVTSGVHGTEPASREGVLIRARDICYDVDGQYTDYLLGHQMIIVPTLNPDRMHISYRNAQNIDVNRVIYQLDSPEGIAFLKLLRDFDPEIFVDHHERAGGDEDIQYVRAMHYDPNGDPNVRHTIADALDHLMSTISSEGYSTGFYDPLRTGFGSLTSGAGVLGKIAFTPETHRFSESDAVRVDMNKRSFDLYLEWHQNNHQTIDDMQLYFAKNMVKPGEEYILLNGLETGSEFYALANQVPIELPEGYLLDDAESFEMWKDLYDIQVYSNRFVPVNQKSGRIIPHILDPQSDYAVTQATRIEASPDEGEVVGGMMGGLYKYGDWEATPLR